MISRDEKNHITPEQFRGRVMGWISTFVYEGQFLSPLVVQPFSIAFCTSWPFALTGYMVLLLAASFLIYTIIHYTKLSSGIRQ